MRTFRFLTFERPLTSGNMLALVSNLGVHSQQADRLIIDTIEGVALGYIPADDSAVKYAQTNAVNGWFSAANWVYDLVGS